MLLVGFAHEHVIPRRSAEWAAMVLPDGTQVTLCGVSSPDQERPAAPDPRHAKAPCDACLLTAAPGSLAAPPPDPAPADRFIRLAIPIDSASAAKILALAPQSRGPPQV